MAASPPRPDPDPPVRLQSVLRWVWLILGLLLLVLMISAVVFVVQEGMGGAASSESESVGSDAAERTTAVGPLRYDPPDTVAGSAMRIVLIHRGGGDGYSSRASSRSGEGPTVNVAFLEGERARLLLDRPAYIRSVAFPGIMSAAGGTGTTWNKDLRWIVYEMALEDADRSGRIDELDARSLYVSGLDGRGLRRVLPAGYELLDWAVQPGGSLLVTALQLRGERAPMPQRAFVLDTGGAVRPFSALDSVVDAAAVIAAKP